MAEAGAPAAAPDLARLVLRGRAAAVSAALGAFGAVPTGPSRAARSGERAALHLGPDEWWLLAPAAERDAMLHQVAAALAGHAHSLVDITDRQVAWRLDGPRAAETLAACCPLDLDPAVFPVDACTRTLLGKADLLLWRTGAVSFHLEVGRSFGAYAAALLHEAAAA